MLGMFYPDEYRSSAYTLDYEALYAGGYRGILFDVDNTLVPHGAPATPESVRLFERLRDIGFKTCIISNNKEPRVTPFADAMGTIYVYKAAKPSKKGFIQGMAKMGTGVDDTLLVGDQIFTDIWGANRAGVYSILTRPIDPREEIQIIFKRKLEKPVLYFYKRKRRS